MARKTKTIIVPMGSGRDAGKTFELTEMPARRTEKWSIRALLAMAAAGLDVDESLFGLGTAALLAVGVRGLLSMSFPDAESLLDEMMQCARFVPDPRAPQINRPIDDEDVEEVATLFMLRREIVEIHTGFSVAAFLSSLGEAAKTATSSNMDAMPTSPKSSDA